MKKVNKFLYGWKFYVNYGYGWEYETFETDFKEMLVNKKAYRENCSYPLKVTRGKEDNPEYQKD